MDEEWKKVPGNNQLGVSSWGRIENIKTGRILSLTANQQGIVKVSFLLDHRPTTRSVAVLVAEAFLPEPPHPSFDTPINLDGDRSNNRADNLMWKPRWFAIKYHRQFANPDFYRGRAVIENLESGDRLSLKDTCVTYGLYFREVVVSATNQEPHPLTGHMFRLVRN